VPIGIAAVAGALALSALAGLPLYGDGAYYFFRIAVDGLPVIPNHRLGAVLPQLPTLIAARVTEDVLSLRHTFAISYAALPFISLLACWFAVRRSAPVLVLFPALFFVVSQTSFSAVSELLLCLYIAWPFVLLASLYPIRRAVWAYGLALAPLLSLLHPLSFAPLFLLCGIAALAALRGPSRRTYWALLAAALGASALARLVWTWLGANAYERSFREPAEAAYYLFAATQAQGLFLFLVLGLALLLALAVLGQPRRLAGAIRRTLGLGFLLLPVLAAAVGFAVLAGEGIKPKAAALLPVCLVIMLLAAVAATPRPNRDGVPALGVGPGRAGGWGRPFAACALAMTLLILAKSAAWWTATRGLIDAVGSAEPACLTYGPEEPYSLQWPWMAIVDNWTAPLNALIFRGPWPIPLLLPKDGCPVLDETGLAHLNGWTAYPFEVLNARFGPLRP